MLRHIPEPGDTGGFEFDVGVKSSGDGAVDDGLLLLVEQRDDLLTISHVVTKPLDRALALIQL